MPGRSKNIRTWQIVNQNIAMSQEEESGLYMSEKRTVWEELRYLSIGIEKLSVSDAMN